MSVVNNMRVDEIPPELAPPNCHGAETGIKSASLYEVDCTALGSESIGWPDH